MGNSCLSSLLFEESNKNYRSRSREKIRDSRDSINRSLERHYKDVSRKTKSNKINYNNDNNNNKNNNNNDNNNCLLYTSPSPRDRTRSRMPSSA